MLVKRKHKILFFLLCFAVLLTLFVYKGYHIKLHEAFFDWVSGIDRNYYEKMHSIKVGMEMDDVIKLLGKPDQISTEPEITETHGRFGSGSNYGIKIKNRNKCLIYYHGVDIIGHYFIDEEGKVYFVNVGGT